MTKLAHTFGAAVALAISAMAGAAQAGGPLNDDYGNRREAFGSLCDRHPDDARCDVPAYRPRPLPSYGYGHCAASVRAAGKRNLIPAFARNSALFSWQREVRAVHGSEYAGWSRARRASISCGPAGGALTGCLATATPCRS